MNCATNHDTAILHRQNEQNTLGLVILLTALLSFVSRQISV